MYDMYNPLFDRQSFQQAEIQVYPSKIKIRVPLETSRNEMKLHRKSGSLGPKFLLAQAIIKKYKDQIFWKHECHLKREERKSSQSGSDEENYSSNSALITKSQEITNKKEKEKHLDLISEEKDYRIEDFYENNKKEENKS